MISLNQPLAAMPTDTTIAAAMTLLAIAADPAATKARLDQLVEQTAELHAAYAEAVAARDAVVAEQAKFADLVAKEAQLATAQAVLTEAQTQMQVAASALRDRETKIAAAEVAQAKERDEIAAREKALAAKLASYRQALA